MPRLVYLLAFLLAATLFVAAGRPGPTPLREISGGRRSLSGFCVQPASFLGHILRNKIAWGAYD